MKRKFYLFIALLSLTIAIGCEQKESAGALHKNPKDISKYEELVSDFEKTSVKELNEKIINQDSFILYVGRETCPYCRMFVPKLHISADNVGSDIYYLDVGTSTQNDEISSILQTLQIKYVPGLISFNGQGSKEYLDIDSENITVEEINNFLQ